MALFEAGTEILSAWRGKGMAEIKSTLELVLERTKRLEISKEEKEEIKRKQTLQKATTLFHRYMEDRISVNEIMKELERMEVGARDSVKENLLSEWIDALSVSQGNEKLLRGIEVLKGRSLQEIRERLDGLLAQYEGEKKQMEETVRLQQAEALRKEGIYGDAVVPRVKAGDEWKAWAETQDRSYGGKLEELRKVLRAS